MINLGGITAYFKADMRDLQTKVARSTRIIRDFGSNTNNLLRKNADNFRKLGRAATVASVAIAGASALILKATADIEQGYIEVAKRTGFAGQELKDFAKELEILSVTMRGVTIQELQNIAAAAGQLGISGKNNILKFTRTIAMMGVATNLTAEEAAVGMARLTNVLGETVDSAELIGSVMNELSNNTTATSSDLLDLSLRMGAAARQFGLTTAEVMGLAASIRDAGARLESGGSAMIRIFGLLLQDIEKFAEVTGIAFDDLAEMIQREPLEAIRAVIAEFSKMDKIQATKALDELGLSGVRVSVVMRGLAGAMERLDRNLALANDEAKRGTSLYREYEAASTGLNAIQSTLGTTFRILGKTIGGLFVGEYKGLLERTIQIVWNTATWVETNRELASTLLKIVAITGLVSGATVALGASITALRFTAVPVFSLLASVAGSVATALAGMTLQVGIILAAIVGLSAVAYAFRAAWQQNLEAVKNRLQDLADAWNSVMTWLKDEIIPTALETIAASWARTLNGVKRLMRLFANAWGDTLEWLREAVGPVLGDIADAFSNLFEWLSKEFYRTVLDMAGHFAATWDWIKKVKEGLIDAWGAHTFSSAVDKFMQGFRHANKTYAEDFWKARGKVHDTLQKLKDDLADATKTGVEKLKDFADNSAEVLKELGENIKDGTKLAGIYLKAFGTAEVEHLGDLFITVKKQAKDDFNDLISMLKEKVPVIGALFEKLNAEMPSFMKDGEVDTASLRQRVEELITDMQSAASEGLQNTEDEFKYYTDRYIDHMTRAAKHIEFAMSDMFTGIMTGTEDAADAFQNFGRNIVNAMTRSVADMMSQWILFQTFTGLGKAFSNNILTAMGRSLGNPFVMHSGGYAGIGGANRNVPALAFAGAPRLHSGLAPDEFPAILQRGERVIPKGGGGGNSGPMIVINNNSGIPVQTNGTPKFDGEKWVVSLIQKNVSQGGPLRDLIQQTGKGS